MKMPLFCAYTTLYVIARRALVRRGNLIHRITREITTVATLFRNDKCDFCYLYVVFVFNFPIFVIGLKQIAL